MDPTTIPVNRMLTLREVIKILCISESSAKRLLREGTFPIPHSSVGSQIRFSPTLVNRYLTGENA